MVHLHHNRSQFMLGKLYNTSQSHNRDNVVNERIRYEYNPNIVKHVFIQLAHLLTIDMLHMYI